jgi:hypothetical protein
MTREKTVAIGAATGVLSMVAAVAGIYQVWRIRPASPTSRAGLTGRNILRE